MLGRTQDAGRSTDSRKANRLRGRDAKSRDSQGVGRAAEGHEAHAPINPSARCPPFTSVRGIEPSSRTSLVAPAARSFFDSPPRKSIVRVSSLIAPKAKAALLP